MCEAASQMLHGEVSDIMNRLWRFGFKVSKQSFEKGWRFDLL
jgi:hypothetical protein